MKKFKYKFTPLLKALLCLGLVLSAVGFGLTLFFLLRNGTGNAVNPIYPILRYVLMFFITVTLAVLLTAILINSAYVIDGKVFKTKFGLIVSKYDVEKIENITLDRKTQKLTVTFTSGEFMVIVVKQDWYGDFIDALLAANPKIEYTVNSLENDPSDKPKQ